MSQRLLFPGNITSLAFGILRTSWLTELMPQRRLNLLITGLANRGRLTVSLVTIVPQSFLFARNTATRAFGILRTGGLAELVSQRRLHLPFTIPANRRLLTGTGSHIMLRNLDFYRKLIPIPGCSNRTASLFLCCDFTFFHLHHFRI